MRHVWIFIVALVLAATAHAEPKAGDPCKDKDAQTIGANGEMLGCMFSKPEWRLSDQNDCQINAGEIIDGAKTKYRDGAKGMVLNVTVPKNLCFETSHFHNFTLADTKTWKVEVVARDDKQRAPAYKITPKAANSMTSLYLQDTDGYTYSLMLKSAK